MYILRFPDKLNIIKLFAVEGDSLHLEGRRANLDLVTSNSVGNIEQLSKLARCAGADYVLNEGNDLCYFILQGKQLVLWLKKGDLKSF